MTTMASQINSLTVVYSIVNSDADQRKHQSSASLAFVWGIHRDRWIPRTKGQLRGICFHLMTSSWHVEASGYYQAAHLSILANQWIYSGMQDKGWVGAVSTGVGAVVDMSWVGIIKSISIIG